MSFKSLSELVQQNSRQSKSQRHGHTKYQDVFDFLDLVKNWEKIVGAYMAKHTSPLKIRNKTLIIMTDHPSFASEISFIEGDIRKSITKFYPSLHNGINKIRFQHSESYFKTEDTSSSHQEVSTEPRKKVTKNFSPYSPQYKEAEEDFSHIEDEDLKKIFVDLKLQK